MVGGGDSVAAIEKRGRGQADARMDRRWAPHSSSSRGQELPGRATTDRREHASTCAPPHAGVRWRTTMGVNQHATLSTKPCPAADAVDDLAPPMQPLSCGSPLEDSVDEQVARAVVFTAIVGVPLRWAIAIGTFTGASNVIPYMGFAAVMLGGLAYALLAEDNHPLVSGDSDHHDRESRRREQCQTSLSLRAGLSGSCDRRMDRRSG